MNISIKDKKIYINHIVSAGIFLAYLIFNGMLLVQHELWRDEANVWLMARELSPIQLFKEIKYQGHPCLWYLIVMPFAKVGLPFQTIGVLSLLVMAVTAALFLWKAPLHRPVKAVCLISPVFTYFYAVIARNYCLIALILMLLAWCYPKRNEKCVRYGVLLGLLVQADTIAIVTAGMISFMWLWENALLGIKTRSFIPIRNLLKGIWIPLASLLLWIAQFYQVSDSPVYETRIMGAGELLSEIRNFSYGILIRLTGREQIFCFLFFVLFFVLAFIVSFRIKSLWAMLVMVSAFLFQAAFSAVVYQLHIWHYISLCFVFLWMLWILYQQKEEKQMDDRITKAALGAFQILLLFLSVCMFRNWNSENEPSNLDNALNGVYSDGVHAAEYIKENISDEELIVSANVPMASTVLAYLKDYEFYYAGSGERTSYADWSEKQSRTISLEELRIWANENFSDKDCFYLLQTGESGLWDADELDECEMLYQSQQETARGEEYIIYRISIEHD